MLDIFAHVPLNDDSHQTAELQVQLADYHQILNLDLY
jgi:hypothetical protein